MRPEEEQEQGKHTAACTHAQAPTHQTRAHAKAQGTCPISQMSQAAPWCVPGLPTKMAAVSAITAGAPVKNIAVTASPSTGPQREARVTIKDLGKAQPAISSWNKKPESCGMGWVRGRWAWACIFSHPPQVLANTSTPQHGPWCKGLSRNKRSCVPRANQKMRPRSNPAARSP